MRSLVASASRQEAGPALVQNCASADPVTTAATASPPRPRDPIEGDFEGSVGVLVLLGQDRPRA